MKAATQPSSVDPSQKAVDDMYAVARRAMADESIANDRLEAGKQRVSDAAAANTQQADDWALAEAAVIKVTRLVSTVNL